MSDAKMMRLSQAARKLNVGSHTIVDFLTDKGFQVDSSPNSKITPEQFGMLSREFADSASDKQEASELTIGTKKPEPTAKEEVAPKPSSQEEESILIKNFNQTTTSESKEPKEVFKTESPKLQGFKVVGKIDLDNSGKPAPKASPAAEEPVKEEPKTTAPKVEATPKEEPKKEPEAPRPVVEVPKVE